MPILPIPPDWETLDTEATEEDRARVYTDALNRLPPMIPTNADIVNLPEDQYILDPDQWFMQDMPSFESLIKTKK